MQHDPTLYQIPSDEAKATSYEELFLRLKSSQEGLSAEEANKRLDACGPNLIEEKQESILLRFLRFFWGPIPWMIELAAILSISIQHWADFWIIFTLLMVNGLVDGWEEFQAGNAIRALKKSLALKCVVKRGGKWQELDAEQLVPGDLVKVKLGNILPADLKLVKGDFLSVDQSALTGESLPVTKKEGEIAFSGSIAKQGEMIALVTSTGQHTFFGKTTKLVEKAKPVSHFQKAILQFGDYLIYLSIGLGALILVVQLFRNTPFIELIQFILILVVASIPVAMPAVLSVTMALGALKLSKMKAIATKLESIEEIAGIDVLCSDKTGTLTKNELTLGEPAVFGELDKEQVILQAALTAEKEGKDPIDGAILNGVKSPSALDSYTQEKFTPFDPMRKRADATIRDSKGTVFSVTKGAPQVVMGLCSLQNELEDKITKTVAAFAEKGYRTLGVARSLDGKHWEFLGVLPLFDPIREDSIQTIQQAKEDGITVKMLTGDHLTIAKEVAHQLQIGDRIFVMAEKEKAEQIETSDGFAQIVPEDKFQIVKALQSQEHIVAMTGDGVNDAPALKQADVGIAVSGATDAARAAASLVLLAPGLSVIIEAIKESRHIFERMNSYAIYRITEMIRVMLFMTASILAFNFYPVTAMMIIFLALLNDIPILTIAYDRTRKSAQPVRWQMKEVFTIATVLGCIGILSTFLLLFFAKDFLGLSLPQIQSFIFLKLSVAGHQTLFIARTKGPFYMKPYPAPILLSAILATQLLAVFFVGFGIFFTPIPWKYIGLIWAYTLIWMFLADWVKRMLYRHSDFTSGHHQKFLRAIKESFHFKK